MKKIDSTLKKRTFFINFSHLFVSAEVEIPKLKPALKKSYSIKSLAILYSVGMAGTPCILHMSDASVLPCVVSFLGCSKKDDVRRRVYLYSN